MESLNATRAELALIKAYLGQSESRDKICRAIQYGSKFISGGEAGAAREVDKTTSLARKVFRLLKVSSQCLALCVNTKCMDELVPFLLMFFAVCK